MCRLVVLICALVSLCSAATAQSELRFARCKDHNLDVAIEQEGLEFLTHLHVQAKNCQNQRVVVRLLCYDMQENGQHISAKELHPSNAEEIWSLFFRAPAYADESRSAAAIYQVELAVEATDPSDLIVGENSVRLDPLIVKDSFAWKVSGGQVTPVSVMPGNFLAVKLEGRKAFYLRTAPSSGEPNLKITAGLVNLPEQVDAERAARRIYPN